MSILNAQPIEKRVNRPEISVHSIFRTIQGEGPFCGTPCTFVRLAGCNLQCPACDTSYTTPRKDYSIGELINELRKYEHKGLVVITGGEPFRQNLTGLINELVSFGYYIQIESNGTLAPPTGVYFNLSPDQRFGTYLVCSPKTAKVNKQVPDLACCYKYVMDSKHVDPADGLPITVLGRRAKVARPPAQWARLVYLQPMDEGCDCVGCKSLNQQHMDACIKSCMDFGYIFQLQIHKMVGLP